jgi:hypothetical protein
VEDWKFEGPMAGRRIPEWDDEFSHSITRSRLHTSLMWMDPAAIITAINHYDSPVPDTPFTPCSNLFHPLVLPFNRQRYFYDTCAQLYHAIGGDSFSDQQLDAFDHFNFGTIPDIVIPHLKNADQMLQFRIGCISNPMLFKGCWRMQEEYYKDRQPFNGGKSVIAPIDPKDAVTATQWNIELCKGNQDAMAFNDQWYNYCHGIDDLIDTMEDGRPAMSRDEIIGLFFKAAVMYNSRFWKMYSELLFPIVLQVTNEYADSVAWEKSPKKHLRAMADVMRTCGNTMYKMVALICGGEDHMKVMGRKIQERDWIGQHDALGNPT